MKVDSLTVFDMDEDGLVTQNGKTVALRSMKFRGQDCKVLDIVRAATHYYFNSDAREFACCAAPVKPDAILIVTDKKYVVPCYSCEGWSTWKKEDNGHGMELKSRYTWSVG